MQDGGVLPMKKILFVMMIIFGMLTFAGAGYVLYTGGEASPGFGVIPMLFSLICSSGLREIKKKESNNK